MACGRGLYPLCFVAKSTYERVIIKKEDALRTNTEGTIMLISAIRRWRIRRLYNAGEWSNARKECESELATANRVFAAELVVRCLYNEGQWQALLDFTNRHPESDLGKYAHKAKRKLAENIEDSKGIPEPEHKQDWNTTELLTNW